MIRNVVMGRVREDVSLEQLHEALQALRELTVEGLEFSVVADVDLGLRDGNASYAITSDFESEVDYRVYDADPEHNRIRRELFAPISESIERVQVRLPN